MRSKKFISSLICLPLTCVICIISIRLILFNTALNDNWGFELQQQFYYYLRVSNAINNDVSQLLKQYNLPSNIIILTKESDIKYYTKYQTNYIIDIKAGNSDRVSNPTSDFYTLKFVESLTDYLESNPHKHPDFTSLQFEEITENVTEILVNYFPHTEFSLGINSLYLTIIDSLIFLTQDRLKPVLHSTLLISVGLLMLQWQKKLSKFVFYLGLSIFIAGLILLIPFFIFYNCGNIISDETPVTIRTQLVSTGLFMIFRCIYSIGNFYFILGSFIQFFSINLNDWSLMKNR